MKRKLVCILSAAAVSAAGCFGSSAADISEIKVRDNLVTVTGTAAAQSEYTVAVFGKDYIPEAVSAEDMENYIVGFRQDSTGENGEFSKTITLAPELASGTYNIKVADETDENAAWKSFEFLSETDIREIVLQFNGASAEKLAELAETYADKLILEKKELYGKVADKKKIFGKMYAAKTKTPFASFGDISDVYDESAALCVLEQQSTAESLMKSILEYEDILKTGIEKDEFFAKLESQNDVAAALIGGKFETAESFKEELSVSLGLRCFEQLGRGDMESLIEKYKDYLTFPSGYWSGKYKSDDFLAMYKRLAAKNSYNNFDDVSEIIATIGKSDSSGGGNGGSGGKGGVSGGGGAAGSVISTDTVPSKPNVPEPAKLFTDLENVAWAEDAIMNLAGKKIITGYGDNLFMPNNSVTRAEFAKMAVIAFGLEDETANVEFFDVSVDAWYYKYVAAGVKSGLLQGMGSGMFGPEEYISRQDMAVILYRAMEQSGAKIDAVREYSAFDDENEISEYAEQAVKSLYMHGVVNGSGGSFQPQINSTRAMAAKMIYELIVKIG